MLETPEEKETGRIEAFSDGVFAIAITLLILEIKVPNHDAVKTMGMAAALLAHWPSYLAYLVSFATILVMWVNHHRIFTVVRRSDHAFLYWNGLLLLLVGFVPFPTALLADYLLEEGAKIAVGVYSGTFLGIAVAFNGLWRHAAYGSRLISRTAPREDVEGITRQYRFGPILYLVAFALSWVSAWVSLLLCFGLAIFFALRGGGKKRSG